MKARVHMIVDTADRSAHGTWRGLSVCRPGALADPLRLPWQ